MTVSPFARFARNSGPLRRERLRIDFLDQRRNARQFGLELLVQLPVERPRNQIKGIAMDAAKISR